MLAHFRRNPFGPWSAQLPCFQSLTMGESARGSNSIVRFLGVILYRTLPRWLFYLFTLFFSSSSELISEWSAWKTRPVPTMLMGRRRAGRAFASTLRLPSTH
ncbi:hypothetical protein BDV59DRAFT_183215 [Aspergillus ambiguus]|uniref:uncharacterized protein n=1 Tax=Aspergillus ambiguus TaxID=176160 RepID=UPI003CCD2DE5